MTDARGAYGIQITVGTTTKYLAFRAPKELYDGIAAAAGLDKLDTPQKLGKAIFAPAATYCNRIGISYEKAGKKRTGSIWVAPEKFEDVLDNPPATYRTYAVTKAFQPLDTTRH
ncbi:hypothetical protein [Floridanema aerugineum]|uniref:Uncharacterized protein n=1 Tax=Floridaenema aerugineum BLCC-F46 TaxID=3153654 RepID=A0ABV4XDK3_9CYAN